MLTTLAVQNLRLIIHGKHLQYILLGPLRREERNSGEFQTKACLAVSGRETPKWEWTKSTQNR